MTTRRTSATASATVSLWMPGLRSVPRALPTADGCSGCRAGRAGEMCPAGVCVFRGSARPARSTLLLGQA
eukprot:12520812-Heterocapsa_arctica.AAC.1